MKIDEMADVFLNSANFSQHSLLTLVPPSSYNLNLKLSLKFIIFGIKFCINSLTKKNNLCGSHLAWVDFKIKVKQIAAFWSAEPTDFKNVIVETILPALSEVAEVAEVKQHRNPKLRKFYYEKS